MPGASSGTPATLARHCRNRPSGLGTALPAASTRAGLQPDQVPSGSSLFPVRVNISTWPPDPSPRQLSVPHRATLPASEGGARKTPEVAGSPTRRYVAAGLLVAATI